MKSVVLFLAVLMVPAIAQAEIQSPFFQNNATNTRKVELSQHPFANKNPFATNMPAMRAQNALKLNQGKASNAFKVNGDSNNFKSRQNWEAPKHKGVKPSVNTPRQKIDQNLLQQEVNEQVRAFMGNN